MSETPPWVKETVEYLLQHSSISGANWLDFWRVEIGRWNQCHDKLREALEDRLSDLFPWVWEVERLVPDRCVVTERTFESIDGFMDCLQTRVLFYSYLLFAESS